MSAGYSRGVAAMRDHLARMSEPLALRCDVTGPRHLRAEDRRAVLASLDECFSAADGLVCLHCCGNTDWAMLLSSRANVISLDAYTCDESFALYPESVARFSIAAA